MSKRRRQVGSLAERLGLLSFGKKMGTLDGDRYDTSEGIERSEIQVSALGRQNPNGLRAESKRNERRLRPVITHYVMACMRAVGRRTERTPKPGECLIQLISRRARRSVRRPDAAPNRPPSVGIWQSSPSSKRRATYRATSAIARSLSVVSRMSRLRSNSRVTSCLRFLRFTRSLANSRRQLTGDHGHNYEDE